MTAPCTHWQDIGIPQGGFCTLHARTCSLGVCRACLDNTAPGQWPPAKTVLTVQPRSNRKKEPCGGCRAAELIRKSKEQQI